MYIYSLNIKLELLNNVNCQLCYIPNGTSYIQIATFQKET